jgi:hypothetical protein
MAMRFPRARKSEIFILLIVVVLLSSSNLQIIASVEEPKLLFSFVQVTDTQIAKPAQLKSITDFILNNKTQFDIRYVVHTGDVVSTWNDTWAWNTRNSSFSGLNGQVSFGWLTGNHDIYNEQYIGNQYFSFNPDNWNLTSSFNQGENTAQLVDVNENYFLFINIQFNATKDVLQWFDTLYSTYNYSTVILSTHAYMDPLNGYYMNNAIPAKFLDNYPNVKLVLSGHIDFAYNQKVNNREEIVFDRQGRDDFPDESDYVRIYSVYTDGQVNVITYSNFRDSFLNDSLNNFNFKLFDSNWLTLPKVDITFTPSQTPFSFTIPSNPYRSPTQPTEKWQPGNTQSPQPTELVKTGIPEPAKVHVWQPEFTIQILVLALSVFGAFMILILIILRKQRLRKEKELVKR